MYLFPKRVTIYMLGAKCGFAPSLRKPRILALLRKSADRAECFAQTSPTCTFSPRFQLAYVLPAQAASCRSWFASRKVLLYATQLGVSEQGATPSFFTELAYAVLATRSCLSYGKQCASLQRPNKGLCLREATARSELADLARHTRFVCAILGLSRKARIRGLRKKILGWCESALCA